MKKWTDHETHFNVNEHANETEDSDSSGSITSGQRYLVYVHDIYINIRSIYLCPYVYGHAERPAMYFDGCLGSELSQLNCVTWKCLNIIKANLIIEARRTTTNKCMKEVRTYLRCSDGFWCCASHYKYVVGTTLGSECVIVWVTECSSSAWV